MKSAAAIAFDYAPSRRVALATGAVAVLALGAVALSGVPTWLKLALCVAGCAYAAVEWRRFVRQPLRRAAWHAAGHWRVVFADGAEHTAELRHAVVRGAWIVLVLRGGGVRLPLVLGPDNCDDDTQRRLRVRLARVTGELQSAAERRA